MKLNANSRHRITVTTITSVDPADGTVTLLVDDLPYACSWAGPAVEQAGSFTRVATTNTAFAGPDVPAPKAVGAVVLTRGKHNAEAVVEIGDVIIGRDAAPIEVS